MFRDSVSDECFVEELVGVGATDSGLSEEPVMKDSCPCFRAVDTIAKGGLDAGGGGDAVGGVTFLDFPAFSANAKLPRFGNLVVAIFFSD